MSTEKNGYGPGHVDPDDPNVTRFDLVREGARRDGIEIVYYAPRFPRPGTRAERRIERLIALLFVLAGLAALAFVVIYIWWPWEYQAGRHLSKLYTPLLGLTLGISLACVGIAVVTWAKKLMPEEVAVEKRHVGESPSEERKMTAASLLHAVDETGVTRRPLLKGAIAFGLAPIGVAIGAPIVGSLIRDPHKDNALFRTGFHPDNNGGKPVRLVREDYSPVRPEDISAGGQITVFPGIPEGVTNKYADSPTLLIRLRPGDAAKAREHLYPMNEGSMYEDFVAYSKICTHLGCPASLYEQQTNRLLCPCHQSQFLITDNAKPIFGPAARALPMLPIDVDEEGYFIAKSDFKVAIGPSFWERP
ncbi:MAG: Rieske 2Fe-2S domain-containing protein [Micromonosporaceae bacterium]